MKIFDKLILVLLSSFLFLSNCQKHQQAKIQRLANQLFQMCTKDQNQQISLYECQQQIIQHDKKSGNYRKQHDYDIQTFYMMQKFDGNKDERLTRRQTLEMAYTIMQGDITDRKIQMYWNDHKQRGLEKISYWIQKRKEMREKRNRQGEDKKNGQQM